MFPSRGICSSRLLHDIGDKLNFAKFYMNVIIIYIHLFKIIRSTLGPNLLAKQHLRSSNFDSLLKRGP